MNSPAWQEFFPLFSTFLFFGAVNHPHRHKDTPFCSLLPLALGFVLACQMFPPGKQIFPTKNKGSLFGLFFSPNTPLPAVVKAFSSYILTSLGFFPLHRPFFFGCHVVPSRAFELPSKPFPSGLHPPPPLRRIGLVSRCFLFETTKRTLDFFPCPPKMEISPAHGFVRPVYHFSREISSPFPFVWDQCHYPHPVVYQAPPVRF